MTRVAAEETEFALLADSAFPCHGALTGKVIVIQKELAAAREESMTARRVRVRMNRVKSSIRQVW